MKTKSLLLFLLLDYLFSLNAQTTEFKVDCGNDTAFCQDLIHGRKIINHLGTNIKITNGVPPFKYSWSCKFCEKIGTTLFCYYASDFLSDTTILNPVIRGSTYRFPIRFYLKVTDSLGNRATDSINVKYSVFVYGMLNFFYTINKGDSLYFGTETLGGGIHPLKYYWTPITGVADSAANPTWFKPSKYTSYYQYAIDSAGCISDTLTAVAIDVITTFIKSYNSNPFCLHQEGQNLVFNNSQSKLANLSFYNEEGKKVYSVQVIGTTFDINNLADCSDFYICILNIAGKQESCKVIKRKKN